MNKDKSVPIEPLGGIVTIKTHLNNNDVQSAFESLIDESNRDNMDEIIRTLENDGSVNRTNLQSLKKKLGLTELGKRSRKIGQGGRKTRNSRKTRKPKQNKRKITRRY